MAGEPKRFSDFAEGHCPLDGSKLKLEGILNTEILVLDYRLAASKYQKSPCLTLQFQMDNEKHIFFTGSTVLAEQIETYKDKLPFYATIKKIDKYYTFT